LPAFLSPGAKTVLITVFLGFILIRNLDRDTTLTVNYHAVILVGVITAVPVMLIFLRQWFQPTPDSTGRGLLAGIGYTLLWGSLLALFSYIGVYTPLSASPEPRYGLRRP
jgi:hypothetical protein